MLPTSRVIQPRFDRWAREYDNATPIQCDTIEALTALVTGYLPQIFQSGQADTIWLDIGCGTGKLSQAISTKIALSEQINNTSRIHWYGLDNATKMLEIFEQNLGDFQQQYANFSSRAVLADMQSVPLHANSVNQIVSSFALHWVGEGNIDKMVIEMGRVLAPNGQIHVAIPVAGSLSRLKERCAYLPIYPFAHAEDWLIHFDRLIQQQGGEWLYQKRQGFSHPYLNVRTLLQNLKQMGGTFSHANSCDLLAIKNLRHYLQDEQSIELDYQVLFVGLRLAKQSYVC